MKAYTDLEQSKKLAEILPLESADMRYSPLGDNLHPWIWTDTFIEKDAVPCWSLAALLDVFPEPELIQNQEGSWMLRIWDKKRFPFSVGGYDNNIDACYNMILKLHELKML